MSKEQKMKPIDGKDLEADLLAEILEKDHESARYGAMVENGTMTSRDVAYMQGYMHGLEFCYTKIRTAKSIEKHGYWIDVNGDGSLWRCSVCGELQCCESNYCGDCGAKMDVEEENENK